MNWIELLYPKPHFDLSRWPKFVQVIHGRALAFAYYVSQTIALIGLTILYGLVIIPIRMGMFLAGKDPLGFQQSQEPSYLKKSDPVQEIDFTRMY